MLQSDLYIKQEERLCCFSSVKVSVYLQKAVTLGYSIGLKNLKHHELRKRVNFELKLLIFFEK